MKREDVVPLLGIQEIDQEIDRILKRLRKIGEERDSLLKELGDLQERKAQLQRELEELRSKIKETTGRIEEEENLLEKAEAKLRMVRRDVEYKAVLREKSKHEDNILKMSYELDELKERLLALEEKVEAEIPRIEKREKEIKDELNDLDMEKSVGKNRLRELEKLRNERIKNIDSSLIDFYERARKRFNNYVVVAIEDGVCGGCGMRIPDVMFSRMIKENSIETCPSCGRYIYYKL